MDINDGIPIFVEEPKSERKTKEYPAVGYHTHLYLRAELKQESTYKTRLEYIRKKYKVPTFFGKRVRKGDLSGMICGCDGDYIMVKIYKDLVFWLPSEVEYL
jgi:hypothetical protein